MSDDGDITDTRRKLERLRHLAPEGVVRLRIPGHVNKRSGKL